MKKIVLLLLITAGGLTYSGAAQSSSEIQSSIALTTGVIPSAFTPDILEKRGEPALQAIDRSSLLTKGIQPVVSSNQPLATTDAVTLLATTTTTATSGKTYYLSTSGTDAYTGQSSSTAWKSLSYAISKLKAGDTLNILAGTYYDRANIEISGTSGAWITIQGVGTVILDGIKIGTSKPTLETYGNDYLAFKNLTIRNGWGIKITSGSHDILVDGLKTDNTLYSVWMRDAYRVTVRNCVANKNRFAFRGEGTTHDVLFENVQAHYSVNPVIQSDGYINGDGFIFEDDTYNLTFRNIVADYSGDAGMDIKGDNVIIDRLISKGNNNGLKLWGIGIKVTNSLIYGQKDQISPTGRFTPGTGINVRGGSSRIYNCTISDNSVEDVKVVLGASLHLENCIVTRRSASGRLRAIMGTFTSANVLWYRFGRTTAEFVIPYKSLWADPGFADWGAFNYRLRSTSLAVNKGLMTTGFLSTLDLAGLSRVYGTVVDLGAYEYRP